MMNKKFNTLSTIFLFSVVIVSGIFISIANASIKNLANIEKDKSGNYYQTDSNKDRWSAVDGRNWNFAFDDGVITDEELETLKKIWVREREIERIKVNVNFAKMIFQEVKREVPEKWDPSYIKNQPRKKMIWQRKIPLLKVIQDENGVYYQIDSNSHTWVSVDGKNWNARIKSE